MWHPYILYARRFMRPFDAVRALLLLVAGGGCASLAQLVWLLEGRQTRCECLHHHVRRHRLAASRDGGVGAGCWATATRIPCKQCSRQHACPALCTALGVKSGASAKAPKHSLAEPLRLSAYAPRWTPTACCCQPCCPSSSVMLYLPSRIYNVSGTCSLRAI